MASVGSSAQGLVTREYTYGKFTGIEISDHFVVDLKYSEEHSVGMTAYPSIEEYVHTYVKAGVLYLEIDEKGMPSELKKEFKKKDSGLTPVRITVSMSSLNSLAMGGSSVLSASQDTLKTAKFHLKLSKNAQVKSLNVEASSSALLETAGNTALNAFVKTPSVDIEAVGKSKSEIKVDASRTIASASGFAKIEIFGESERLSLSSEGSAKIEFNTK